MASPCDTLPKNRCPASINSFDENWPVVAGGGEGATPGGGWGGSVPGGWAIASVDATAIRLAIAATRELGIMAGSREPSNSRATGRPSPRLPIPLHAADRQWVMRADPAVQFWEGDTKPIGSGLTLVRLGGHFDGGTVLHWADWSEGRGVLLSGDILQVVPSG